MSLFIVVSLLIVWHRRHRRVGWGSSHDSADVRTR